MYTRAVTLRPRLLRRISIRSISSGMYVVSVFLDESGTAASRAAIEAEMDVRIVDGSARGIDKDLAAESDVSNSRLDGIEDDRLHVHFDGESRIAEHRQIDGNGIVSEGIDAERISATGHVVETECARLIGQDARAARHFDRSSADGSFIGAFDDAATQNVGILPRDVGRESQCPDHQTESQSPHRTDSNQIQPATHMA